EAHRDERNDEAEQERHVLEEVAHVGLTARHEQLLEEHVPGGGDVRRHQDVGDGRVDVALELALGDGHRVAHVQAPCVVVSLRKTSSRLAFSGVIWRRSMPEAVAITRAMSPRGSAPVLAMTRNCVARGRSESDQPLVLIALMSSMPSMWRSSVSGSDSLPRAPPISSRIDEAPEDLRARSSGVPSATSLPSEMMMMREQVACTSPRMWVEKMTVFSCPIDLMTVRISAIWLGSRPEVGSSRMSTSGSCTIACARPTRWRKPLDSSPMSAPRRSPMPHCSTTRLRREWRFS